MTDDAIATIRRADSTFVKGKRALTNRGIYEMRWAGFAAVNGQPYRVTGWCGNKGCATTSLESLCARAALKPRRCLTCHSMFESEGAHHRMCHNCRRNSAGCDNMTYSLGEMR